MFRVFELCVSDLWVVYYNTQDYLLHSEVIVYPDVSLIGVRHIETPLNDLNRELCLLTFVPAG